MTSVSKHPAAIVSLCLLALPLLWTGCGHGHDHDNAEHSHDGGENRHDAHGGHEAGPEELEARSVTVWADKTELFMEYEPLIVDHTSRFAAHLTTLYNFKASTAGVLSIAITLADGSTLKAQAEEPSSPGIFRFEMSPTTAGPCSFALSYRGPLLEDTIDGGTCRVFADDASAHAGLAHEGNDHGIAFTKEQQWKTEFATIAAGKHRLQRSVRATGQVTPVSGREARLTAPARGRVTITSPTPLPGMKVEKGQLLATVSPYLAAGGDQATLDAEALAANAALAAAEAQLARLERLFEEQAIPERRLEETRAEVSIARARLDAATGRLEQYNLGAAGIGSSSRGSFQVRSSIDGTLVEIDATSGDSVEEGKLLFVVIDLSRVWLVAKVFEPDIPEIESATTAWFEVEGYEHPFTIDARNGRLITVGRVIDPKSRTVPVIFEMENPGGVIRIGQFAKVFIATGDPIEAMAVPESAILEDGGKRVIFVQSEGETFVRRVPKTGLRAKGWVEITNGLEAGERVVTKGADEIRRAAASGAIPEHGHVH